MYKLEDLITEVSDNLVYLNGKWVPARPINYKHRTFFQKIKEAYLVYKGKADVFIWPENQ